MSGNLNNKSNSSRVRLHVRHSLGTCCFFFKKQILLLLIINRWIDANAMNKPWQISHIRLQHKRYMIICFRSIKTCFTISISFRTDLSLATGCLTLFKNASFFLKWNAKQVYIYKPETRGLEIQYSIFLVYLVVNRRCLAQMTN